MIVSVAGWLVVVLSLLSNAAFTVASGVMMKPLFGVPLSQATTADVASTVMYSPASDTGTPAATATPGTGGVVPFTTNSVHAPFAMEIVIVPPAPSLFTNIVSVAFAT